MMCTPADSLRCRELRLRQFRNLARLDLSLPAGGVAIIGNNGAGKTNLLEALYYLEIFRSFRGAGDEQLVRFGEDAFFIGGVFEDGATGAVREITAGFDRTTRRKRVSVDGTEPERFGDVLGGVGVIIFSPSDVDIIAGSPGARRRFLDILLSLNVPGYLSALQHYRQVLRQRNAMLRQRAGPALLAAWNEGLIAWGARVTAERAAWVGENAADFARRYALLGGGSEAFLRYRPAGGWIREGETEAGFEAAEAALRRELERLEARERERSMTLAGPHRDRLVCATPTATGEWDLRDIGSGGQQRTAAIVLRLLEAETMRRSRGNLPLLLLDDCFAELDADRARRILEMLEAERWGQVILTSPKASDLEPRRGLLARWGITDGVVSDEAAA